MDSILDRIVAARRETVAHRQKLVPLVALKMMVEKRSPPARDFAGALAGRPVSVIAEMKKASPSRGVIRRNFDPIVLAASLERAGAVALSVLTEEEHFQGSMADLKLARDASNIPILRKDFIVDTWQVWETRASRADSFLLIAAVLSDAALFELLALGRQLGMEALVEVHTRAELSRALNAGARIIGVNNRDLKTFEVRLEISLDLIGEIPEECVAVSESGISSPEALAKLRAAGFDAFLIGEHLMQKTDPAAALSALLAGTPSVAS